MSDITALGLVVEEPGSARVRPFRSRPPGPTQVRIATSYSGISTGTDRWVMQGRFLWGQPACPFVPGYQRAGTVVELGAEVETFTVGQSVVATNATGLVDVAAGFGSHLADASSEAVDVHDATGIDPAAASLFISGQVGVNAASRILAAPGSNVVVFGDGIIGASAALAAKALGFTVLLVGRHDARLAAVERDGIRVLNARTSATSEVGRFEPAAAIDTVQSDDSFAAYLDALPRRTGEVVFSGHSPDGIRHWADMAELQKHELTAHFVSGWTTERIERTLDLMRTGRFPIQDLIGVRARGIDGIDQTVADVLAGTTSTVAAVLDWGSA